MSPQWGQYFAGLQQQTRPAGAADVAHGPIRQAILNRVGQPRVAAQARAAAPDQSRQQGAVSRMIQVYANRGHLVATIDPLGLMHRVRPRVLDLAYFDLGEADLDTEFFTGSPSAVVPRRMRLRDIVAQLEHIYCGPIGAEFAHVSDTEERLWLQAKFQDGRLQHRFSPEAGIMTPPAGATCASKIPRRTPGRAGSTRRSPTARTVLSSPRRTWLSYSPPTKSSQGGTLASTST